MSKKKKIREVQNPCPVCQAERYTRVIEVVDAHCWREQCRAPMKMAFGHEEGMALAPEDFTTEEIKAARGAGAKLEIRHSKTMGDSYLHNVCPSCDVISGSFYLHDYWHEATPASRVFSRLSCARCEGREDDEPPHAAPVIPKKPAKKKEQVPPKKLVTTPLPKPVSVWGKCAECAQSACPRQLTEGSFFCAVCKRNTRFIPDVVA
ncbi:hypothetical protein [Oleiharenicola lentus]|uniref:hypothetical protein n=1 Tax=Oleiharenicola lentus TaxID=2508720 RepID=UPI003F664AF8